MSQSERAIVTIGEKPLARKENRHPAALPGFLRLDDGSQIEVAVADLSNDGCKISLAVALLPGTKLKLSVLSFQPLEAHVRWYSNGMAGLRFSPAISPQRPQTPRDHERHSISATVS